jgi:hypothetical protein
MKGVFRLWTTTNRIKVVTKDMVHYLALMHYPDASKIPYYIFHPKSLKPVALGCSVINIRWMTATQPKSEGGLQTYNIPLLLVTLTHN